MTDFNTTIIELEDLIKSLSFINIYKELIRENGEWKLIYDIEGLVYENFYIPYIKLIFFVNKEKTEFTEDLCLVSGGFDYRSMEIVPKALFDYLKNDSMVQDFSNFVVNGVSELNKLTKDPFINFEQKKDESGIKSINKKYTFYTLERSERQYNIALNVKNGKTIEIDNKKETFDTFEKVYDFIIKTIDK